MQPLDFRNVVAFVKDRHGFEDYAQPLGQPVESLDADIKNPAHPGDMAYGSATGQIERHEKNLSQDLIDAQHESFRDALELFMSPGHVFAHMCTFFQSDFLNSSAYLSIKDHPSPAPLSEYQKEVGREPQNSKYSFDLSNPNRKSRNRSYYTDKEMRVVAQICGQLPAIRTTVLVFQAGFLDYIDRLGAQIANDERLNEHEKNRGAKILDNLTQQWKTTNFSNEVLPAICLAYHDRDPERRTEITARDFECGFEFGMRAGLYKKHLGTPDGGKRELTCPARIPIGTVASKELGADPKQNFPQGHMLGIIHRRVLKAMHTSQPHPLEEPTGRVEGSRDCPMSSGAYTLIPG